MLVDSDRVLLLLKQEIASKSSHGQRDLLAAIARLEAECAVPESLVERQLRLVVAATRDVLRPAPEDPRVDPRDGLDDSPRAAGVSTVHQEDQHHEHHPAGSARRSAVAV